MTLRTLNYGNYGIFLIMGNAGFCPSAVRPFGKPRDEAAAKASNFGAKASATAPGTRRDLLG